MEKIGVPLLHRRKIQWILKDEVTEISAMRVTDWMRREMRWPPDVVETYQKTFESYERVTDLQKLTLEVYFGKREGIGRRKVRKEGIVPNYRFRN